MERTDILKKIRKLFNVPAYDGVKIETSQGEIGVIIGAEDNRLKVYFEGKADPELHDPEKVAYLGLTLKK